MYIVCLYNVLTELHIFLKFSLRGNYGNEALGNHVKSCVFWVLPNVPHYENMPMQYAEIFKAVKNENFQLKFLDIFLIFAQNIDCGYTLEPPR